jgi:hypothetical protein
LKTVITEWPATQVVGHFFLNFGARRELLGKTPTPGLIPILVIRNMARQAIVNIANIAESSARSAFQRFFLLMR